MRPKEKANEKRKKGHAHPQGLHEWNVFITVTYELLLWLISDREGLTHVSSRPHPVIRPGRQSWDPSGSRALIAGCRDHESYDFSCRYGGLQKKAKASVLGTDVSASAAGRPFCIRSATIQGNETVRL